MIVRCGELQTVFCISPSDLLNLLDSFDPRPQIDTKTLAKDMSYKDKEIYG